MLSRLCNQSHKEKKGKKGNPGHLLLIQWDSAVTFAKSPTSQFPELRRFKHFLPGGQQGWSLAGGGILGPGLKSGWENKPQTFLRHWIPQSQTERGSEKTRRPEGHVKLKVYKLKEKER